MKERINPWPPFNGGSVLLFSVPASSANRHAPYVNVARVFSPKGISRQPHGNWYAPKRIYQIHDFSPLGPVEKNFKKRAAAPFAVDWSHVLKDLVYLG